MEGGVSQFVNFTILKAFLKARSQSVSGTSNDLLLILEDGRIFFLHTPQSSGQPKNDAKTLISILHHLSPVIFANAAVVAFVQLCNSTVTHSVNQCLLRNQP